MSQRSLHMSLGIGASIAALLLIFVAIPQFVSTPSNVSNIVLSPLFWPYTLSALTGITGLGLIATALRTPAGNEQVDEASEEHGSAIIRLIGIAVLMAISMLLIQRLGMVWTCMLAFAGSAFLVKTRHRKTAAICAIIIPLVLYAFFAHVAGVAIPQGEFVRLP